MTLNHRRRLYDIQDAQGNERIAFFFMAGSVGAGGGGCELGQFGNDLLFRLRLFVVELSPLREHPDDIKELARY
jgi:hypothetical protein